HLVQELVLESPLLLPEHEDIHLHVSVDAADDSNHRAVVVRSRPGRATAGQRTWTVHARGVLAETTRKPDHDPAPWPPADAERVDTSALYDDFTAAGYEYGPLFQGVQAAWRRGTEIFAEVTLPETGPDQFAIHPALLDAALHPLTLLDPDRNGIGEPRLPFSWTGVTLTATGATTLRVRLATLADNTVTLHATDTTGQPALSIDSLTLRPVTAEQLHHTHHGDNLYRLHWTPTPPHSTTPTTHTYTVLHPHTQLTQLRSALDAGSPTPDVVLATYITTPDEPATDLATAARNATHHALALLQEWLADERLTHTKLLFVTRGAIAARPGEDVSDLANAPVWGLVRSAQREHPDRLWLVDIDDDNLAAAVTAASDNEPQLALRAGTTLAPRLTHHTTPTPTPTPATTPATAHFGDPDGTILITGGTGTLGALLARHLVTRHGSRHLLLTSRRGEHAPGAHALAEELTALGANVTIAACDAADRTTLAALLDTLPTQHPLTTVIHAAGTLDDATITNLTPQQLDHVLQPKIDAALNLHHLTHHHNLSAFILFS
ncbi:SDR family oxidoreductase, partial [Kitasatospora herbaricolor]|uniref:SDR family oxidoreductase n=1 Tax=Kitasatospora herbaricolor TaxID=68217 RepID=UPI0036DA2FE6